MVVFDGSMILALRNLLGRSQEQFAALLGVSNVTVSRWESAGKIPRKESQVKLQKLHNYLERLSKEREEAGK